MSHNRPAASSQDRATTPLTHYKHGPARPALKDSPALANSNSKPSSSRHRTLKFKKIWSKLRKADPSLAGKPEFYAPVEQVRQDFVVKEDFPWADNIQPVDEQVQASLFGVVPLEIRQEIYRNIFLSYTDCIHLLAGLEHAQQDRNLFHTPCITASDFEQEDFWPFRYFRWSAGRWGMFHLPCDLRSSRDSTLHDKLIKHAYDGPINLSKDKTISPPYMSLLLVCRRMYLEARETIYSSTAFSFVGDLALSVFLELVPGNTLRSIRQVHLVWPTWWKQGGFYTYGNRRSTVSESYWGHPNYIDAKAEWEEIWQKVAMLGRLTKLHVTIFREPGMHPDVLLPALCDVQADEFFVEAWGDEERTQEPTDQMPFRISYNPLLSR